MFHFVKSLMLMQETGVTVADTERTEQKEKRGKRNMTSLYFYIKDKKEKQDARKNQI